MIILSSSGIRQGAGGAKQMWRWLAGYSCGVHSGEGREVGSGGGNRLSAHKRDIPGTKQLLQ